MNTVQLFGTLLFAYIIGSIPFGYLVVKLTRGEDIRRIQSGRTGGTNTMRAAGPWAGLLTAILDIAKSGLSVFLAKGIPTFQDPWFLILVPSMVIVGNNYSIFMLSKLWDGKLKFGGGAGGAACLGGALGLWWPAGLIVAAISVLVFYFGGYASVTTISIALVSTLVFIWRGLVGASPIQYAIYGLIAALLLLIALRPNLARLRQGTERLHGFRAKKNEQIDQ